MSVFTLAKALGIIGRHLVITLAIGFAVYFLLPSLNIVENKYKVDKVIKAGTHPKDFPTALLEFSDINAILISRSFSNYLNETSNGRPISSFKII